MKRGRYLEVENMLNLVQIIYFYFKLFKLKKALIGVENCSNFEKR